MARVYRGVSHILNELRRRQRRRRLEQPARVVDAAQQRLDFGAALGIARAFLVEQGRPEMGLARERRIEDLFDPLWRRR